MKSDIYRLRHSCKESQLGFVGGFSVIVQQLNVCKYGHWDSYLKKRHLFAVILEFSVHLSALVVSQC